MPVAVLPKPLITIDGSLSDWVASERIDYGDVPGYSVYAQAQGDYFYIAIRAPITIGANTTAWFNTDLNTATGYQIFGFGGAEYNLNISSDNTASLYTGAAGETLLLGNISLAYSADKQSIEFAIPKVVLGNPSAIDTLYDVNDVQTAFLPANYSAQPYVVYDDLDVAPTHRVAIVYSDTSANLYFNQIAYSDLFMAAQNQARMAGVSYDVIEESQLTNISNLVGYDALIFPSMADVNTAQLPAIMSTLTSAVYNYHIGIITSGDFLTNDQTGAALLGNSYANMQTLLGLARYTGGSGDMTVTANDVGNPVMDGYTVGQVIQSYAGQGYNAYNGTAPTNVLVNQVVGGVAFPGVVETTTGGTNVHFATAALLGDSNLLSNAIQGVVLGSEAGVALHTSRQAEIVGARMDMDQSQFPEDVSTLAGPPGIYDKLIPILQNWKQIYDFVGSYYINIGDTPTAAEPRTTDWLRSLPYYQAIEAMGGEIGNHSYTHLINPPATVPAENTNFLQTATTIDPVPSAAGNPFTYDYEFNQSKSIIEQHLGHLIYGAAVPGAPETYTTAQGILPYYQSVAATAATPGYTGYVTGGWTGIGAGYPGAFGYMSPTSQGSVYIAPNVTFDFTEIEFQGKSIADAAASWAGQFNSITANAAGTPIVVWPIHDYAAAAWDTSGTGVASPYTTQLFTDFIAQAYAANYEFVTLEDLASRIVAQQKARIDYTTVGNTITAAVTPDPTAPDVGEMALEVINNSTEVIQNVTNWYAYNSQELFLPTHGGTFTIHLGTTQDDVTHIAALPMRGDLLSVTGDGLNLGFSMFGEGHVIVELGGTSTPVVTGATGYSLVGDQLDLSLGGLGEHDVTILMLARVTTVAFSADTGSSATDFVTNVATQTISGSLSSPLGAGDVVKVSLDNGTTWLTATAAAGATTFSLARVLTGSNTLIAQVENSAGAFSTPLAQAYMLDQLAPGAPASPDLVVASDSGVSSTDNITNALDPTFTGTAEVGSTVTLLDGTTVIGTAIATAGKWTISAPTPLPAAVHSITATATDAAGNVSAASAVLSVTVVSTVAAPSVPDLVAAWDKGASSTDNITNVVGPVFTGTSEAGSTVTLLDGTTVIGTGKATTAGAWTITASNLAEGTHSISATQLDAAGNVSAASAVLSVTVDSTVAAPSVPDLVAASDKGASSTDNITNVVGPVFTGTSEAGSTVTLLDGTTVIGTGKATTAGAWTITASNLAEGTHSISATQLDAAGNVSAASAVLSVTVDSTVAAPSVPDLVAASDKGASSTDNITNVVGPVFTGTSEAGSTVTLLDGTTVIGTGKATAAGAWTITASNLAEGTHSISATQLDAAGNASLASAASSTSIDTTVPPAPSAPDLTATSDTGVSDVDNLTNVTRPTFTGTAEAGSTVTLYSGANAVGTGVATAAGHWSITTTSTLANGIRSITTKAMDVAGNVSAASGALLITVDANAPARPQALNLVPDVNGVIRTTLSSSDLSQILQGDQSSLRFVSGTEAIILVDGMLSVGANTNEAFVARLYQGVLGRAYDANGLSFWDSVLPAMSKAGVAQGFLGSVEYQSTHAGQDNMAFVNGLYQSMLGRAAEPNGLTAWTQALAGGMSRGNAVAGFADSPEAKQHWSNITSGGVFAHDPDAAFVREDYHAAFGREAETAGLTFWTQLLKTGMTSAQLAQDLTASGEFQILHSQQTDLQYVDSLYVNGLGRQAEPAGEAAWVNALQSGASRSDVLAGIAQSPEGQLHLHWALT